MLLVLIPGLHVPGRPGKRQPDDAERGLSNADRDGVISPLEAPIFFRQSGLPDDILSLVWQYSTVGNAYNAIVSLVRPPPLSLILCAAPHFSQMTAYITTSSCKRTAACAWDGRRRRRPAGGYAAALEGLLLIRRDLS